MKDPWFRHIAAGTKTVEGRIDRGKWGELRTGVPLAVVCGARRKNCVVTKVVRYRSFAELLEHEGLARTLPGVKDVASGAAVYREFYPAELEREHGVVAIHVAVISAQSAAIHADALKHLEGLGLAGDGGARGRPAKARGAMLTPSQPPASERRSRSCSFAASFADIYTAVGRGDILQSRLIRLIATKGIVSPVDVDTCRIIQRIL